MKDGAWGMALMRGIPVNNENAFWPGITRSLGNFSSQFADASGLTGVSPGRNVQLIPYGTFTGARFLDDTRVRHEGGRPRRARREDRRARFGGDRSDRQPGLQPGRVRRAAGHHQPALRGVLPGEAAVLPRERRLLPDADQPVLLPPHRRPAVRRARDREAGRLGRRSAGDRRSRAGPSLSTSTIRTSATASINGVVRARREFGESSVGALSPAATSAPRSTASPRSTAASSSAQRIFADGQAVVSDDQSRRTASRRDTAFSASVNRSGRKLSLIAQLSRHRHATSVRARLRAAHRYPAGAPSSRRSAGGPKTGPIQSFGPNSFVQATWDRAGVLQDWTVRYPFEVDFRRPVGHLRPAHGDRWSGSRASSSASTRTW